MIRHLAMGPTASPAEIAFCERMVMRCPQRVRAACGLTLATLDLHEAAGGLLVPATVIAGRRDRLTPPIQAERLADGLPRLDGELIVREAGHMMPVTHPDLVSERIAALAADHLSERTRAAA
jgi:pimeloyl-ACP methyl ester carboxylesterase